MDDCRGRVVLVIDRRNATREVRKRNICDSPADLPPTEPDKSRLRLVLDLDSR